MRLLAASEQPRQPGGNHEPSQSKSQDKTTTELQAEELRQHQLPDLAEGQLPATPLKEAAPAVPSKVISPFKTEQVQRQGSKQLHLQHKAINEDGCKILEKVPQPLESNTEGAIQDELHSEVPQHDAAENPIAVNLQLNAKPMLVSQAVSPEAASPAPGRLLGVKRDNLQIFSKMPPPKDTIHSSQPDVPLTIPVRDEVSDNLLGVGSEQEGPSGSVQNVRATSARAVASNSRQQPGAYEGNWPDSEDEFVPQPIPDSTILDPHASKHLSFSFQVLWVCCEISIRPTARAQASCDLGFQKVTQSTCFSQQYCLQATLQSP